MKYTYTIQCKKCGKEFNVECTENQFNKGKYKHYCSRHCANSHILTDIQKQHISEGLKNSSLISHIHTYICDNCGKEFKSKKTFKKSRQIHCNDCIRNIKHSNENELKSILDCSKRTITKILKRSNIGCSICGWNEATCDIHHIIPKKNGGADDNDNLIIVCPNCHRVIHSNKKYSEEYLRSKNIVNTFNNWKDFYHPSN